MAASSDPRLEQTISDMLQRMTREEKIGLCSGTGSGLSFRGIPRLHVPDPTCIDGPRGPHGGTAFPSGVLLGATWDPELVQKLGEAMGNETRALGNGMLLGPGINIQRDPRGGRFFEYYTEDPYLNGRLAVAIVKGIQSQGVAACAKHYVCNNREDNRNFYMSMVDPRTLNEIYLPAFKAAIKEAQAWAIMTSANGVNGEFVSDSKSLINDQLIEKWGFDGVVLTDWLQTRSTEKAAFAGLDLSMPGGDCLFAQPLTDLVNTGKIPVAIIDDKVRRVLRLYGRMGLFSGRDLTQGASKNTLPHQQIAREAAAAGLVLLQNSRNLLPLDPDRLQKILVVGPSADKRFCLTGLGGSSWAQGPYEITVLAGLVQALGRERVQFLSADDLGDFQPIPKEAMESIGGVKGFRVQYFNQGESKPAIEMTVPQINFMWEMRSPDPSIRPTGFRAHFDGYVDPPANGIYTLRITGRGESRLMGEVDSPIAVTNTGHGYSEATALLPLKIGHPFHVQMDYMRQPGDASVRLEWQLPTPSENKWNQVDRAARNADAVIFVGGIDHTLDTEGADRTSMEFPAGQSELLHRLVKSNPQTVAVLINGSPLEIGGWLQDIPAVIEAWYPGMEGGHAIADVLIGRINPSGRLPFTWPKRLVDSPSHAVGTETRDKIYYKEGVYVGYRYFDSKNVEPQFPFGFGLSYTTFAYGPLHVTHQDNLVTAELQVHNTGMRDGAETVQIYVHPLRPSVDRPIHELKAFQKTAIKAGQSETLHFTLGEDAFSYFDPKSNRWTHDPGLYEIQAAASSRDVRSKALITLNPLNPGPSASQPLEKDGP